MRSIFKYPIETIDEQAVNMPRGAQILCVQVQHGTPCLWALVEPDAPKELRTIIVHGTGHPVERSSLKYIGTYQLEGGAFIGHVFEHLS